MKRSRPAGEEEERTIKCARVEVEPMQLLDLVDDMFPLIAAALGERVAPLLARTLIHTCRRLHALLQSCAARLGEDKKLLMRGIRRDFYDVTHADVMRMIEYGAFAEADDDPLTGTPGFTLVRRAAGFYGNVSYVMDTAPAGFPLSSSRRETESVPAFFAYAIAGCQPGVVTALMKQFPPDVAFPLSKESKLHGAFRGLFDPPPSHMIRDADGLHLFLRVLPVEHVDLHYLASKARHHLLVHPILWPRVVEETRSGSSRLFRDVIFPEEMDVPISDQLRLFDYPELAALAERGSSGDHSWLHRLTACRRELPTYENMAKAYFRIPPQWRRRTLSRHADMASFCYDVIMKRLSEPYWPIVADFLGDDEFLGITATPTEAAHLVGLRLMARKMPCFIGHFLATCRTHFARHLLPVDALCVLWDEIPTVNNPVDRHRYRGFFVSIAMENQDKPVLTEAVACALRQGVDRGDGPPRYPGDEYAEWTFFTRLYAAAVK